MNIGTSHLDSWKLAVCLQMSWLLTTKVEQLLAGVVASSNGCQQLRGQKRRRGSDLLCHLQHYIVRVGEATEAAETSFVQNQE